MRVVRLAKEWNVRKWPTKRTGSGKYCNQSAESRILCRKILAKGGFRILEDAVTAKQFKIADLEYLSFSQGDEEYISSVDLINLAIKLEANFSLYDGVYIVEHQADIPVEVQSCCIMLTDTIVCDTASDGSAYIPYLRVIDDKWDIAFHAMELDCRIAGCRLPHNKTIRHLRAVPAE